MGGGWVFFDAGETLVHPSPSFAELFSAILAREGHDRSPESVTDAARVVFHRFSEAARDQELWTTSAERSRAFWSGVYEHMLEALELPGADGVRDALYVEFTDPENYVLFDDVEPVLPMLRDAGFRLGIVSNFEGWLEDLLDILGIREAFPVRVISGVEGIEKPDRRIYELALERAGAEPGDSVFVGDNPEFDVDPPGALGMRTVLIDRRDRFPSHEGSRISDLRQLPSVLGSDP